MDKDLFEVNNKDSRRMSIDVAPLSLLLTLVLVTNSYCQ